MNYAYPESVLMIFCKAPVSGQVKTRLTPELTPEEAVGLHIELTVRTLEMTTGSQLCPVQLWCAPSADHPFFTASAADYPITLKEQHGLDLGERMHQAFCSELAVFSNAVLIGCDCPSITKTDLNNAFKALNNDSDCDMVLAPAEDGGYVLIGMKRPCSELFGGMPWGTDQVLNQTRIRIRQSGLRCHELKQQWDLDTTEDLRRYKQLIA